MRWCQRLEKSEGKFGATEISRVRAENVRLKREDDILKKATASFERDVP